MSPRQPSTPSHGRPEQGKDELEAKETKDAAAAEPAPVTERERSEAKAKPKGRRRLRKTAPQAEGTAAAETGVDKAAAQAVRPAPRRRDSRRAVDPDLVVRAQAKYVRSSARKARLVCDHIRGKSVEEARAILAHANRDVARDWSKLLESAVANAEHNHELIGDELRIHSVTADEGPTLKRFRPRAMGRATRIRKRTSHLSITLTPKDD